MDFSESLKSLDELRSSVRDHLEKARDSVKTFRREEDNAFWRDSKQKEENKSEKPNTIITARSYLALFYSEMALAKPGETAEPDWLPWFSGYVKSEPFFTRKNIGISASKKKKDFLNNFELSHLPDLMLCKDLSKRYWTGFDSFSNGMIKGVQNERVVIDNALSRIWLKASTEDVTSDRRGERGEVQLSQNEKDSSHYFVTLHLLRGASILDRKSNTDFYIGKFLKSIREFCVEQAFYGQRGIGYKQDAFRLAFSGTIYCLYEKHTEQDLICAVVEALEKCQQDNGMWPASHPIFREKKEPWHVSSHEIALCLTWLYFQPNVPDNARIVLLRMMECYFRNWIVTTYSPPRIGLCHGWYDDHSIGEDIVVGWATAIVCHFLSGYYWVLCDWINRRVIEELGIERHARGYLIADSAPADRTSTIWQRQEDRTVWPDLPPFRWQAAEVGRLKRDAASFLRSNWTDPGLANGNSLISNRIASHILVAIYENPGNRPDGNLCSILLPGKPGTRKSSVVTQVAQVLGWPRVSIPGSVIFDRGFDYLETRANEVFSLLNMLTSCVVFFDEFEEFLRKRPEEVPKRPEEAPKRRKEDRDGNTNTHSHTRTIAAFTTSSMLTRMQELHDQSRCLIFLATNHENQIDNAAKRPGRVDCRLEIRHPKKKRLLEFLSEQLNPNFRSRRLFKNLNLDLTKESDVKKWEAIQLAIDGAIDTKAIKEKINCDNELRHSGTIPFRFLERALKAERRNPGSAERELISLFENETSNPPDL